MDQTLFCSSQTAKGKASLLESLRSMKGWRFCCCVWFLGIFLDRDSDSDGLVTLDVMNEVELSLANTGAGPSAVPDPSNVSSVSHPWQRVAAVSHGLTPVKEHLALMVARLMDSGFDLLAAFAELLPRPLPCPMRCLLRRLPLIFGTAAAALPLLCDVLGSIAGCEEAGRDSRKIGLWITLEISGR